MAGPVTFTAGEEPLRVLLIGHRYYFFGRKLW